ncbi:MAG TPA: type II toxin-antitoxin system prevent-host-death family antitoxin [Tepidisphaeraceae bacterium]|jgi:prevent-host-death family protein|nr:type II toxin-antitoxin system prevent-host-death family antitoxin [Tepidisphaeraceae bacterium]
MAIVTIEQAKATLTELIHGLAPDEEVLITEHNQPVARLVPATREARKSRQLGTLQGTVTYMAADFDAPLDDFQDYME